MDPSNPSKKMNWYVGQKVVCVDATPMPGSYHYDPLIEGAVYTIRAISGCACGVLFDIGQRVGPSGFTKCSQCGTRIRGSWKIHTRFLPIDALAEQIERIEKEGAPVEPELIEA